MRCSSSHWPMPSGASGPAAPARPRLAISRPFRIIQDASLSLACATRPHCISRLFFFFLHHVADEVLQGLWVGEGQGKLCVSVCVCMEGRVVERVLITGHGYIATMGEDREERELEKERGGCWGGKKGRAVVIYCSQPVSNFTSLRKKNRRRLILPHADFHTGTLEPCPTSCIFITAAWHVFTHTHTHTDDSGVHIHTHAHNRHIEKPYLPMLFNMSLWLTDWLKWRKSLSWASGLGEQRQPPLLCPCHVCLRWLKIRLRHTGRFVLDETPARWWCCCRAGRGWISMTISWCLKGATLSEMPVHTAVVNYLCLSTWWHPLKHSVMVHGEWTNSESTQSLVDLNRLLIVCVVYYIYIHQLHHKTTYHNFLMINCTYINHMTIYCVVL